MLVDLHEVEINMLISLTLDQRSMHRIETKEKREFYENLLEKLRLALVEQRFGTPQTDTASIQTGTTWNSGNPNVVDSGIPNTSSAFEVHKE